MKAVNLVIAVAGLVASNALGQGFFLFDNHLSVAMDAEARFVVPGDPVGTSSIGAGWTVALFGGPVGTPRDELKPLIPASTYILSDMPGNYGYVYPILVSVPDIPAGTQADVWVRLEGHGYSPSFGPFTVRLGGSSTEMPVLPMGTSPILLFVPEPCPSLLILSALCFFSLACLARTYTVGKFRTPATVVGLQSLSPSDVAECNQRPGAKRA